MKKFGEKTNLSGYFVNDNLAPHQVYKSKEKYIPLYINADLYEQLFNEKYDEKSAFNKISEMFSITLDYQKSNNELVGIGYADKQEDPMGISLSGNEGSGRAYFYEECFNIKGDKTSLATSPKEVYSNGKFSLAASIKETIISNILSKELSIPTFETLAILDTTDNFEFISEYLATDDSVKEERYTLPSVIEIRVNKDKRLYRISNAFKNKEKISFEQLKELSDKLAQLEAEKFIKRFLHGSWSVGNISVNANLIDFDTSSFVKGRNPQFSNTNKYKSNYFGFEILGSKMILKLLFENSLSNNQNYQFEEVEKEIDCKYTEYLKIEFCKIIGLKYDTDYIQHKSIIDDLFNKFIYLSKQFLPNYYDLNVLEKNSNNTFVYDFSNFFQHYLIGRNKNTNDLLYGVNLLLNETTTVNYRKVGFIKDKVEDFFREYIVEDSNDSKILSEAINFVKLYTKLFEDIEKDSDINDIKYKQYILNMNRNYLYSCEDIYSVLSYLYSEKKLDNFTLNIIINSLVSTNLRNYSSETKEYYCNLNLCDNYLSYMVLSKEYYYFVLVPYRNYEVRFAKLCFNDEEYMFHHSMGESNILTSEKIPYHNINDISMVTPKIYISGKKNYINQFIQDIDSNEDIDEDFIKKVIYDNYNIEVIDITGIPKSTSNCYCIYSKEKKYFLKVFDKEKTLESILMEAKVLDTLKKNKFNVATIIKTMNNKLALLYNSQLIILEDYIEGVVYNDQSLPTGILLESARILGKMHKILKVEYHIDNSYNIWHNFNKLDFKRNISDLLEQLEKCKLDSNYEYIKELLNYKQNRIDVIDDYYKMFNNLTFSMCHNDYSKRQLICDGNRIVGIVDFSSCDTVPVSCEVIRSYFLSTQTYDKDIQFDYELFSNYLDNYMMEYQLNYNDLLFMPYLLMYQLLLSNYGIKEYIEGKNKNEMIEFLKLKHNICLFLERESNNISKQLINDYESKKKKVL